MFWIGLGIGFVGGVVLSVLTVAVLIAREIEDLY